MVQSLANITRLHVWLMAVAARGSGCRRFCPVYGVWKHEGVDLHACEASRQLGFGV